MLSSIPLFSIKRTRNDSPNNVARIMPGIIRAMNPRKTMIPIRIVSPQIESSLDAMDLIIVWRSVCPVSICCEAVFIAVPWTIGKNMIVRTKVSNATPTKVP